MFLQGLRTVKYGVTNTEKAKQWYSEVLGFGPCQQCLMPILVWMITAANPDGLFYGGDHVA